MSWLVSDKVVIVFVFGFYFGVVEGMIIENVVNFGIGQVLVFNELEDCFLLYKDGVKVEW